MATKSKHGLGRGLGALFGDIDLDEDDKTAGGGNTAQEIPISQIVPNENQPRKNFDEAALLELANSIRVHGVISPLILVRKNNDEYMIIAGERRWRAARKAGLVTVPAIVRDYSDKEIKEISLIENLQREDLNPIEVANAIKQLMDEYDYTQEQVADRIGKSRPAVANTLRLLTLSPAVIDLVALGKLSEGHARCLVVIKDPDKQLEIAKRAIGDKLTVRDFEKLVKSYVNPPAPKQKPPAQSLELRDMVERLQRVFSTKVSVFGNDRKGRIFIDYYSADDLDRIHQMMQVLEEYKRQNAGKE
ncbi:MAG TPA: ParB/RepB/Spo0J family partition protein [Firmicutes bacterium]|nr:ParB/RepB/Spo0J family partition protein [Bacillota bacterium]